MQLQARYYSGIFWGPLQLVSAAIPKNSGYSMIVSVVLICWYMIVYRRDSTSRQFTHRCTVRIMCLSDTVHTQQGFPSIVYFVRPVPSQSKTLSCSHDFEVGLDWFMEFVRNDIEQQSLLYLSHIYIYILMPILYSKTSSVSDNLDRQFACWRSPTFGKPRGWCFFLQLYLS